MFIYLMFDQQNSHHRSHSSPTLGSLSSSVLSSSLISSSDSPPSPKSPDPRSSSSTLILPTSTSTTRKDEIREETLVETNKSAFIEDEPLFRSKTFGVYDHEVSITIDFDFLIEFLRDFPGFASEFPVNLERLVRHFKSSVFCSATDKLWQGLQARLYQLHRECFLVSQGGRAVQMEWTQSLCRQG